MLVKSFKLDLTADLQSWKFSDFPGSSAPTSGTLMEISVFGIGALHGAPPVAAIFSSSFALFPDSPYA